MTKIFISYVREDRDRVAWLAERLGRAGFEVWFDQNLKGGRAWWEEILSQIRAADVFVYALGPTTLESAACAAECAYAQALQTPVLPVRLSETVSVNLLPQGLVGLHVVDVLEEEDGRILDLAGSLNGFGTRGPLPEPLPAPPAIPLSYLAQWAETLRDASPMDEAAQLKAVAELRRGLARTDEQADAQALLKILRGRRDILASVAGDVDVLLTPPPKPKAAPKPKPEPTPQPVSDPVAFAQEMSERLASEDVGIDWDEPPLWVVLVAYLGAGALVSTLYWAFIGDDAGSFAVLFMTIFLFAAGCYRYATHSWDWWIDLRMVLGA
ncbi:MAG: toll/interleukin-1 receptor domain-containing protein, partial [Pseudomonadota bacterium]